MIKSSLASGVLKSGLSLLVLYTLASCQSARGEANGISLTPVELRSTNDQQEPVFVSVDTYWIEVSDIYARESGFVAILTGEDQPHCLNLFPANGEVRTALVSHEGLQSPRTNQLPSRFRLELDAVADVPARRGSYLVLDDEILTSSAPYYIRDGKQTWLSCSGENMKWQVHRVVTVLEL